MTVCCLGIHCECKLVFLIPEAWLSHPWHNFHFSSSSQFLSVVDSDICLRQPPPGEHLTVGQLDTTYLTCLLTPTLLMDCLDMPQGPPTSQSQPDSTSLCLLALNPSVRTLCRKPAWVTPWTPKKAWPTDPTVSLFPTCWLSVYILDRSSLVLEACCLLCVPTDQHTGT